MVEEAETHIVTGAFGYTGKYIKRRLLATGSGVRTLTGHMPREKPLDSRITACPFNFGRPEELARSLRGATTLFNTYWVRFPRSGVTFEKAVENTRTLIKAAQEAGIRRIVHISITNASEGSPIPYFRNKGLVEKIIVDCGLSYAIVRPTVIFGAEDILINNIAWLLRRFPFFAIPGQGDYRLQPVYVEDVADIAVWAAGQDRNLIIDAVGHEVYPFDGLVRLIAQKVGSRARVVHVPPGVALSLARLVGFLVKDVLLTKDEVKGLMASLLISRGVPTARTSFSQWLEQNAPMIGARYASEIGRHYRAQKWPVRPL